MQSIIRGEFVGRTVLYVEHDLKNILDYDRVAVFDGGCLTGFGSPEALLRGDSKFKQLLKI